MFESAPEHRLRVADFFTAADGLSIRYGIWPVEAGLCRGSVLLLNGRKEFLEKYAETIAELNIRGFTVFSIDWRGQGLSARLLTDRNKGHVGSYRDYLRDLSRFVDRIVLPAAQRPVIVLAHSMGAHIALRFLHDQPAGVDRAVLTSPMIDIQTAPCPRRLAGALARGAVTAGLSAVSVPGAAARSVLKRSFEGNPLTSDRRRFDIEKQAVIRCIDLAVGPPTFGWLAATVESIAVLHRDGFLEAVTTPLLMVAAGEDPLVSESAQRDACDRLPHCRFLLLPDARHEVLMECDRIRAEFWNAFDRFTAEGG